MLNHLCYEPIICLLSKMGECIKKVSVILDLKLGSNILVGDEDLIKRTVITALSIKASPTSAAATSIDRPSSISTSHVTVTHLFSSMSARKSAQTPTKQIKFGYFGYIILNEVANENLVHSTVKVTVFFSAAPLILSAHFNVMYDQTP